MPITEPKRDNPLMRRYFRVIELASKQLAKKCGVFHSQIYMARTRNVGLDNAEKITRSMAPTLGFSESEPLELKAEIMDYPGDQVPAYFGSSKSAMKLLDVPEHTALEHLNAEKSVTHKSGMRALAKLREIGAPEIFIQSVEMRLMPASERLRGPKTDNLYAPEMVEQRMRTRDSLPERKRKTYEALQRSGLMIKEVRERSGVGKESVRNALQGKRVGAQSARTLATVLGEGLSWWTTRLGKRAKTPPSKTF